MSEEAELMQKVKRASQMLLLQRYRRPGVKGWELRRAIGKDYKKVLEILDGELSNLGLQIKTVFEEGEVVEATPEQLERARFFITMKSPPAQGDVISSGYRIDDVAVLSATLAYVISRQGKAPRKDVEKLLEGKFPRWKVGMNLDRFIRRGYILEDKEEMLHVGWRTRAEIDQKALMSLLLATPTAPEGSWAPQEPRRTSKEQA